jgi:hypothetical protein
MKLFLNDISFDTQMRQSGKEKYMTLINLCAYKSAVKSFETPVFGLFIGTAE